jgi:hypothetical protein
MMYAAWLQEDQGLILGGYGLVFASLAAFAWFVARRGRSLAKQIPDEDKPWT